MSLLAVNSASCTRRFSESVISIPPEERKQVTSKSLRRLVAVRTPSRNLLWTGGPQSIPDTSGADCEQPKRNRPLLRGAGLLIFLSEQSSKNPSGGAGNNRDNNACRADAHMRCIYRSSNVVNGLRFDSRKGFIYPRNMSSKQSN